MTDANDHGRALTDEERARAVLEQLKSVHAFDLAYETMVGLVSFGYQKMGLTDETRPVRDLDDARLSIELVRATLDTVERETGAGRTHDLRDALAQMQLAYAHAVQLANAERAAAAETPAAEPEPETAAPAEEPEAEAAAPAKEPEAETQEPAAKKPAAGKPRAKKKPAAGKPRAKKKPPADEPPAGG